MQWLKVGCGLLREALRGDVGALAGERWLVQTDMHGPACPSQSHPFEIQTLARVKRH